MKQVLIAALKQIVSSSIRWEKPDKKQLAKEYDEEKGFFDVWQKEVEVGYPTKEGFVSGAQKLGKVVTFKNSDIGKFISDPERKPETFKYLEKAKELVMPIVFQVQGAEENYIQFSGRHRASWADEKGIDIPVFVIPYPEKGEELYSLALGIKNKRTKASYVKMSDVVGSPNFDRITDEGFIHWLELFLTGEDINYPDKALRGFKSEYAKNLKPFKLDHSFKVYRGLSGEKEGLPDWLLKSIGVKEIPKVGDTVTHSKPRPTSWTTNLEQAKGFSDPNGLVVSTTATPQNSLMDVKKLYEHLCNSKLPHWQEICEIISIREEEIVLLSGKYKTTVEYVDYPNRLRQLRFG